MNYKTQCVFCDKGFEFDGEIVYDATIWKSGGNYGSRLIDCSGVDLGVDKLIIIICDSCLKLKKDKIFVEMKRVIKEKHLQTLVEKLEELKDEQELWNK